MNTNQQENFDPAELIVLLRKYDGLIARNIAAFVVIFLLAAIVMPHKYKSSATITIYTKYFQNPLVKDFLPEPYDISELKSQRETLIRQSFTDEYLNKLGEEHHLFKSAAGSAARTMDIEALRKRIDVYSLQTTTFELGFVGSDKHQTYELTKELLSKVIESLAEERQQTILRVRDSIQRRVEAISLNSSNSTQNPLASGRPELIRKELAGLEEQRQALLNQYTPQHPKVTRLQARINLLKSWLSKSADKSSTIFLDKPALINGEPKAVTVDVYEDLLKKLNYLNILLDMEQNGNAEDNVAILNPPTIPNGPVWPNKLVFLLWGILSGVLVSAVVILAKEYLERSSPSLREFCEDLDVSYLGNLPKLNWKSFDPSIQTQKTPSRNERSLEWH